MCIRDSYTAYSGILKVYKGDAYHDALFKYGSLIATGNDATATAEQEMCIRDSACTMTSTNAKSAAKRSEQKAEIISVLRKQEYH